MYLETEIWKKNEIGYWQKYKSANSDSDEDGGKCTVILLVEVKMFVNTLE